MTINSELLNIIACPKCKGDLSAASESEYLCCEVCLLRFEIRGGIPILLLESAIPFQGKAVRQKMSQGD